MKRVTAICMAMLLCTTMIMSGCSKKTEEFVLTVDGEKYTQADYNLMYSSVYNDLYYRYQQYNQGNVSEDWLNESSGEEGETIGDFIFKETKEQFLNMTAFVKLAEKNGIKLDEEMSKNVKTQLEEIKKSYGGEKEYNDFLKELRTTEEAIVKSLEISEISNALYEKLTAKGGEAYVKDEDIEAEFLEQYKDMWRVQHILVSTMPQTDAEGNEIPARSDEEARILVAEIIKALDNGMEFSALIEEYNEDPGMTPDGYYTFGTGEMVAEFEEASKNLEIGAYTKEGVKTSYGYHIIKRYAIDKETDVFEQFKNNKIGEKLNEIIDAEKKDFKVKSGDKKLREYVDNWNKEKEEKAKQEAKEKEELMGNTTKMQYYPAETEHSYNE